MGKLARIFILTVVTFVALIYVPLIEEEYLTNDETLPSEEKAVENEDSAVNELQVMVGMDSEDIMKQYGIPARRYPSMYGYEWWVYFDDENSSMYFQVGVKDGKIVTSYVIGEDIAIAPFRIGDSYEEIIENHPFSSEVSFAYNENSFIFSLSERELAEQPLIQLEDNIWAQLYFDTFENKLSSIRFLNTETLLLQRPYELSYMSELPSPPQLTDEEKREVEQGEEQTVLDLTNMMRARFDLPSLTWNEKAAAVALSHSKDMADNQYFSHISPTEGDLSERLQRGGVSGSIFGENIIANYVDAAAAMEGWMNSEGHRENILREEFTSLGVGVYNRYYTQNFIMSE